MMDGWRAVLAIDKNSDDLLAMHRVGKVYTLPEAVSQQIKRFPDLDPELFLGWKADLTEAFKRVRFDTSFSIFTQKLTDSLLINIRFCAYELEKRLPEKEIAKEELKSLRDEIWALYERIQSSGLSHPVERYLLDRLYAMLEAIDDYEITGSMPLEKCMNEAIGTIATSPVITKEARASKEGMDFWKILGRVGFVLSIARSAAELADSVQRSIEN